MFSELVLRVLIVDLGMVRRLSLSTFPAPSVSVGIIERKLFGERMALLACHQDFSLPKLIKWVPLA